MLSSAPSACDLTLGEHSMSQAIVLPGTRQCTNAPHTACVHDSCRNSQSRLVCVWRRAEPLRCLCYSPYLGWPHLLSPQALHGKWSGEQCTIRATCAMITTHPALQDDGLWVLRAVSVVLLLILQVHMRGRVASRPFTSILSLAKAMRQPIC